MKEFVVCAGDLWIRECTQNDVTLNLEGKPTGTAPVITMRPATAEELAEYLKTREQETKC